jgi:hypothetical protein
VSQVVKECAVGCDGMRCGVVECDAICSRIDVMCSGM